MREKKRGGRPHERKPEKMSASDLEEGKKKKGGREKFIRAGPLSLYFIFPRKEKRKKR